MSSPKPNAAPSGPSPGVEPLSQAGIGVPMQDLALPDRTRAASVPSVASPEFDVWLRLHLAQLHAGVLAEPIPDRFLRLLGVRPDSAPG
jgi:hypothetical protein